ncbi:hypothetical protein [Hyphomicrobium sp.]|uniref:hypothetical protein n=1 Tax=Hyphomicrobium sp. TaxID=82 RepID=UPI001D2EC466|nr:hypothetical protein [Hyphomicrobium sp.]MBY0560146.1 hypothetical protein [Hyphomicrobium sp.]
MERIEFYVIAEATDPEFVADLAKALGWVGIDRFTLLKPMFKRTDGRQVSYRPTKQAEYDALPSLSEESLKKIGCKLWDSWYGGARHWLYPPEWFPHIPNGHAVVFTNGRKDAFDMHTTSSEREIGALSFGFIQQLEPGINCPPPVTVYTEGEGSRTREKQ